MYPHMGMTNLRYSLESKIAQYRGELETVRAEVETIEAGVTRLSLRLRQRNIMARGSSPLLERREL